MRVEVLLLVFGAALLLAVLTSNLAARSPLSSAGVFLGVGLLAGPLGTGLLLPGSAVVERAADVALFAVLFADGQHASLPSLRGRLREPAAALLLGMPLTAGTVAVLGHLLAGLDWGPALVLGAVLSPTDPVFASALVGREDVPRDLRRLLNVESGLNDGLALPAVLVLLGTAGAHPEGHTTSLPALLGELGLGLALGVGLPLVVHELLRVPNVGSEERLRPLGPLAVAVLLYALCSLLDANPYLAAFAAGSVIATVDRHASEAFERTGTLVSELAKDGALLLFAALVSPAVLSTVGLGGAVLVAGTLLLARPLPVMLALVGSRLPTDQRLVAAWFGPKGFASVVYAVIVLDSGLDQATEVFGLVAATVVVSIALHSSTDVPIATVLRRRIERAERAEGSGRSEPSGAG